LSFLLAQPAMLQPNTGDFRSLTVYNVSTRRDAGTKANSSAIDTLTSTVRRKVMQLALSEVGRHLWKTV
jgi:hypothetical protein